MTIDIEKLNQQYHEILRDIQTDLQTSSVSNLNETIYLLLDKYQYELMDFLFEESGYDEIEAIEVYGENIKEEPRNLEAEHIDYLIDELRYKNAFGE